MKWDRRSFGVKLWLYFSLFSAIILMMLWLFQIVFMQSFYEDMKSRDIARLADEIVASLNDADLQETLDRMAFRNSALVILADAQGVPLLFSDEHGRGRWDAGHPGGRFGGRPGAAENDTSGDAANGVPEPGMQRDFGGWLTMGFADFLDRLNGSGSDTLSYIVSDDRFPGRMLIFGRRVPEGILYMSTPLEPLNATTDILGTQLIYVTVLALLLSFVIAFFIARRFQKPVKELSREAGEMAAGNFQVRFDRGFCSEIDELAASLDHAAKELSKVENLRRELIANISHELRTPLTMIRAYAEMVRDISGDSPAKRQAHLSVIMDESERLTELVNDILDLSALQSDNVAFTMENTDVSALTREILKRFEGYAQSEGIRMKARIDPDQYALCDGPRLSQVLYNLIGNAIGHIGEGRLIEVALRDLGSAVRFEVRDDGEGIPAEDLRYIWERYRSGDARDRKHKGTGLGLSIARDILQKHGARYGVESEEGKGSVFWFEIMK